MRKIFIFSFLFFSAKSLAFTPECADEVHYAYYSLCYSSEHMQALWTFHFLSEDSIRGPQKRTNNFKRDSSVYPSVGSRDYRGSGFDRGHLVPAGDMKLNYTSMSETFFMTNMSPQRSGFNSGIWRALESGLRDEVLKLGDAFVFTGPVLIHGAAYDHIRSGVSIPDEFYKIAYFPDAHLMLAYLIPNHSQRGRKYHEFQVSVDAIEEITGLDFFAELPDAIEEELEALNF